MKAWKQRVRSKQREQVLRDNISYRQNLREVDRNERSMEKLVQQYAAMAVEAEKNGNHSLAVRMAAEAARLKKHQTVTGGMRGALEIAHAVQSTNRAMTDIMEISRNAAGPLMTDTQMPDAYTVQTELCVMQEQVQAMMEESEMLYEDLERVEDLPKNEEGERYLKTLMTSSRKDKQLKLLQDTNSYLEKLQRSRNTEHEGGK